MIAIGAVERVDQLRERLTAEFQFLQSDGIDVQIKTVKRGDWTFLGCDMAGKKPTSPEISRRFRLYVANAVSDEIVNRWEEAFLRKLIQLHYNYFDPAEQETILACATRSLYSPEGRELSLQYRVRRKGKILARLTEYLEKHNELILDGFVTFRLKDYVEELEDAVDLAVEEFLMEKEYGEFVRLLRYFVDVQEPRLGEVEVFLEPGGSFRLLDGAGSLISKDQLAPLLGDLADDEVDHEDMLVSALVTLVPVSIVLHPLPEAPAGPLETVRKIFGERATLCPGCAACREAATPAGRASRPRTGPLPPGRRRLIVLGHLTPPGGSDRLVDQLFSHPDDLSSPSSLAGARNALGHSGAPAPPPP